jgi:hypothetical protein
MNPKELEAEATRAAIHAAMLGAASATVLLVGLYLVIKAAVRDGINEANRASRWAKSVTSAEDMPDMRAER